MMIIVYILYLHKTADVFGHVYSNCVVTLRTLSRMGSSYEGPIHIFKNLSYDLTKLECKYNWNICFQVRVWIMCVGFTCLFGALFSKTWRVHILFRNHQLKKKVCSYCVCQNIGTYIGSDIHYVFLFKHQTFNLFWSENSWRDHVSWIV